MARVLKDTPKPRAKRPPKAAGKPRQASRPPRAADAPPALQHPPCAVCGHPANLTTGEAIYPHRRDLHRLRFWRCPVCPDSYVGCHKGGDGTQALGRPADAYLRKARGRLHELIDPLWQKAETMACYYPFTGSVWNVRSSARKRTYAYLRVKMRLAAHEAHIAWLDLEQCREAWRVFSFMDGMNIRDWWHNGGEDELAAMESGQ